MFVRNQEIQGVVLAGGKGRRMGRRNALIELGGKTLLQRAADCLSTIFTKVLIVTDNVEPFSEFPYQCVTDEGIGLGPMGGIATALRTTPGKGVFVVGCDMPFLNPDLIRAIMSDSGKLDLVIPSFSGRLHPLHAFYAKQCLPAICTAIQEGDLALRHLVDHVNACLYSEKKAQQFDPLFRSVTNINTPEELKSAQEIFFFTTSSQSLSSNLE